MSPDRLLALARELAEGEDEGKPARGRPEQARLRRAVSTAYYALFHLLTNQATRRFLRGKENVAIHPLMLRMFDHGEMKDASKTFAGGNLPKSIEAILLQSLSKPKRRRGQTPPHAASSTQIARPPPAPPLPPLSEDLKVPVQELTAALGNGPGLEQALEALARALRPEGPKPEKPKKESEQLKIPPEIRKIAKAFVSLQEARHGADYDPRWRATRKEALKLIEEAEEAFKSWDAIKKRTGNPDQTLTSLYLLALFTFRRLRDR